MPESGRFTNWQDSDRRGLVVDDDFSWSDAPSPRRRGQASTQDRRGISGTIVIEREELSASRGGEDHGRQDFYELTDNRSYDADAVYEYDYPEVVAPDGYTTPAERSVVYADAAAPNVDPATGRRTVVITGRGAERHPTPRRHRDSELAFYQRGSFRPDSIAMWAVLLGIALVLGSVAH